MSDWLLLPNVGNVGGSGVTVELAASESVIRSGQAGRRRCCSSYTRLVPLFSLLIASSSS